MVQKRKSEMTSYLNNGYDVINYFAKFEKFLPHGIIITSFMTVGSHKMPELHGGGGGGGFFIPPQVNLSCSDWLMAIG